jgi:deoxyribose-phosphate aldolase
MTGGEVAKLIDHTLLRPEATQQDIEALCRDAIEFGFMNVCVNPTWISLAAGLVAGSGVGVCAVVGFPFGATTIDVKTCEARGAIAGGAREIDMVINIGRLKSGDRDHVQRDVDAVTALCRKMNATSKIIIETALLTGDEKAIACRVAKKAGADFVKTSTGFAARGATAADVQIVRRIVGTSMGIKAAGGIRDFATVKTMVAAGATRIGTTASVNIMREAIAALETRGMP